MVNKYLSYFYDADLLYGDYSDEYDAVTYYFDLPVELLNGEFPEADSTLISIELPQSSSFSAREASVQISPAIKGDGYAWSDYDLPYDVTQMLINLAINYIGFYAS